MDFLPPEFAVTLRWLLVSKPPELELWCPELGAPLPGGVVLFSSNGSKVDVMLPWYDWPLLYGGVVCCVFWKAPLPLLLFVYYGGGACSCGCAAWCSI